MMRPVIELLPQRFPFLMLDRVEAYEAGKSIRCMKNITINDIFFQGHFPGIPIMPGALVIEAMAQSVASLCALDDNDKEARPRYLGGASVRFLQPVVPGDQLVVTADIVKSASFGTVTSVRAMVDGSTVARGELTLGRRIV